MKSRLQILLILLAMLVTAPVFAVDSLVILSPHRKSIQEEFVPRFKQYYREQFKTTINVDWLDQGGTSDDIRFLRARFAKNAKTAGVDLFWGGGVATFTELARDNLLQPLTISPASMQGVPADAAGVSLIDSKKLWIATAMSSFGILYNKKAMQLEKIPEPMSWEDLTQPRLFNELSATDPRRSGSASAMNYIILSAYGWERGWDILTAMAGNTRQFTHSSSDPIKAIVSGDALAATVIDFYALSKLNELGADKLGFILPAGQTILDPDPIALVKGAPNTVPAQRFIEFVLKPEIQQLLMLPVNTPGGPSFSYLGRMSVNPLAYQMTEGKRPFAMNPFQQTTYLKMDSDKAGRVKRVFDDLLGALHVDTHRELKAAWRTIIREGYTPEKLRAISVPPFDEAELEKLADKWGNNVFRNQIINKWVDHAQRKYHAVLTRAQAG